MDSILVSTPVSSPIHPQANLPLLKGYLVSRGYKTKVVDTNILFFHWFLGKKKCDITMEQLYRNPLSLLTFYDKIEKELWEKSKSYKGLSVGMRYLEMPYDRTNIEAVLLSLQDSHSNPFIQFYNQLIESSFISSGIKILGIAITFQDQIIPAFTLASLIRKQMPDIKIVLGGQMITRCHDTIIKHEQICKLFDYLCLWDGEEPLFDIHEKEINGKNVDLINVIDIHNRNTIFIDRNAKAPDSNEIPTPDFSDINFKDYFFPDMLVPIQTTRGCYANCDFCAIPFGSNKYRVRSAQRVVDEIIQIQDSTFKRYGVKATLFKFMEDTSSPRLLFEISREIEKRKLDVKWETFARLEKAFTKDGFMKQLFNGGCRKIHWGLESNDPNILKNMKKKITTSYSDQVLKLSSRAGILNFCFILLGFPGETDEERKKLATYIINNKDIHTITPTTFDLTRGAPMQQNFSENNKYGMSISQAEGFQVRLPYLIKGVNWKAEIVPKAHKFVLDVVQERPDIGLMSLFPDQIRSLYCDKFSNKWGQIFVDKYGEKNIKKVLLKTKIYIKNYENDDDIDPSLLPESIRREHFRTKEDINIIKSAVFTRKNYERRRIEKV